MILDGKKRASSMAGDPVLLFRGYRVALVRKARFDPKKGSISYQLFINAPKRSSGDQQRPLLERQRDRGRSHLGRYAR